MSKRAEELAEKIVDEIEESDGRSYHDAYNLQKLAAALIDAELRKERERCASKIPHSVGAYWIPDYSEDRLDPAYRLWQAGGSVSNKLLNVSDVLEKHYEQLRSAIIEDKEESNE